MNNKTADEPKEKYKSIALIKVSLRQIPVCAVLLLLMAGALHGLKAPNILPELAINIITYFVFFTFNVLAWVMCTNAGHLYTEMTTVTSTLKVRSVHWISNVTGNKPSAEIIHAELKSGAIKWNVSPSDIEYNWPIDSLDPVVEYKIKSK